MREHRQAVTASYHRRTPYLDPAWLPRLLVPAVLTLLAREGAKLGLIFLGMRRVVEDLVTLL